MHAAYGPKDGAAPLPPGTKIVSHVLSNGFCPFELTRFYQVGYAITAAPPTASAKAREWVGRRFDSVFAIHSSASPFVSGKEEDGPSAWRKSRFRSETELKLGALLREHMLELKAYLRALSASSTTAFWATSFMKDGGRTRNQQSTTASAGDDYLLRSKRPFVATDTSLIQTSFDTPTPADLVLDFDGDFTDSNQKTWPRATLQRERRGVMTLFGDGRRVRTNHCLGMHDTPVVANEGPAWHCWNAPMPSVLSLAELWCVISLEHSRI